MLGALAAALGEPALDSLAEAAVEVLGKKADPAELRAALEAGTRPLKEAAMAGLKAWSELAPAASSSATRPRSRRPAAGAPGSGPTADLELCVDCLLCWLYCPDSAVALDGTAFAGFDLDYCKGCELCAAVCPTGAIEMVPDGD